MQTPLTAEVTSLLNNWASVPALHSCWHCYEFAPGAAPGVPCDACKEDVERGADEQARRQAQADESAWEAQD